MGKEDWKEFLRDRITAAFILVAVGDALGMPLEIMTQKKIAQIYGRVTTYIDPPKNHKWHGEKMKAAMWTDDKQLELVMEKSLIRCKGIDMDDIAHGHVVALEEELCGWGGSTTQAVKNIQSGVHWSQSGIPDAAGNGISMKIAPIGALLTIKVFEALDKGFRLCGGNDLEEIKNDMHSSIVEIARMTHKSRMAISSGMAHVYAIFSAITDENNFSDNFLSAVHQACLLGESFRFQDNVTDKLSDSIAELLKTRDYEKLSLKRLIEKYGGKGKARFYVLSSLPLSYALFLRNPNSIETLFDVVNAGGDTDTNASMVGALLGARNGMAIFKDHQYLIDGLWRKDEVITTAQKFCDTFITE